MSISKNQLGGLVKEARKLKAEKLGHKFTQNDLATAVSKSRSFIGDIEAGRTYPSFVLLSKIAEACEVPLSFFQDESKIDKDIDLFIKNTYKDYNDEQIELIREDLKQDPDAKMNYIYNTIRDIYCNDSIVAETPNKYTAVEPLHNISPIDINNLLNIPILGTIRAGHPILATENLEGFFPTSKSFLSNDKEYFYLKVKGDSMDLKFPEGSLLLVEKSSYVENGEIAVVLIDGLDATVKKIVRNDNMITLIPMSSNHEHLPKMYDVVKDDVKIIGKAKLAVNFL